MLLDRGDVVPRPHDARCGCDECVRRAADDSLQYSRSRINAYRALASPSLIALSSRDPVLTAFELSVELKRLSRLENEFKVRISQTSVRHGHCYASGMRNVTVWCPSVRPSVCLSRRHTPRDSPGGVVRRPLSDRKKTVRSVIYDHMVENC